MTVCAVLGGQWGDEAKGKIVDYLSEKTDIVARFSGGNNAGHTVINDDGKFVFHLIPVGVLWPKVQGVIGNGVVVNPDVFLSEINELEQKKQNVSDRVKISERAHIVMPYHVILDNLNEIAKGNEAIGTTGRGIGPAYTDKAARIGIRAADFKDVNALFSRLESVLTHHNAIIQNVHKKEPVSIDEIHQKCLSWSKTLTPFIDSVEHIVYAGGNNYVSTEHFKISGGGHDWPGSWGNMDIHASAEVWKFFSRYDINGLISTITSIEDKTIKEKHLARITDILGRETSLKNNTLLFYIYDDGTIEKRIIIE